MKPERFRTHIEIIHKKWLADNLCLGNNHMWVDLYTDFFQGMEIYFELKCRMLGWKPIGKQTWACREEQIQEYRNSFGEDNVFWMFLIYALDRKVKRVKNYIAKKIIHRELWILPWNFVYKYPSKYTKVGYYRYPKQIDFPDNLKTITIEDMPIHFNDKRIEKLLINSKEITF